MKKLALIALVGGVPLLVSGHVGSNPAQAQSASKKEATVKSADTAEANNAYWQGDYKKAHEIAYQLAQQSGALSKPDKSSIRTLINLGMCHLGLREPEKAAAYFEKAQKLIDKFNDANAIDIGDCKIGLAECHYMQGQTKQARKEYGDALSFMEKQVGGWHPEIIPALEGIAGSYYADADYKSALPIFKKITQIDLRQYGPESSRVGMSLNNLCDAYYKTQDCQMARKLYEQVVWIFKKSSAVAMLDELEKESKRNQLTEEQLNTYRQRINNAVLGTEKIPDIAETTVELLKGDDFDAKMVPIESRPNDFNNWRIVRRAPDQIFFVRIDPKVEQKGLIICLHGLGLHSGAFEDFSHKINSLGYGVLAVDVKGFGALAFEKGQDRVDMDAGLEDVGAMASIVRSHNPNLPIFILGESMGGALALQFAAKFPNLLDALISSVPSGARFKNTSTNLLVGVKFLEGRNKPIEIGKRIVSQATMNEGLKDGWLSDPDSRLKLSAEELINFQEFMNHTKKYAKEIKDTPVIIFQGFQDHLVKPEGTYALYEQLSTEEKDLVFVGAKEHLIFEEGQAPIDIVKMLAAWLDSRIEAKQACASPSTKEQ